MEEPLGSSPLTKLYAWALLIGQGSMVWSRRTRQLEHKDGWRQIRGAPAGCYRQGAERLVLQHDFETRWGEAADMQTQSPLQTLIMRTGMVLK